MTYGTAAGDTGTPSRRGDAIRTFVRGVGQLLITFGVVILLFVAYELWGTSYYTHQQQNKLKGEIAEEWLHGGGGVGGEISEQEIGHVPLGTGIAVLRIPRFGLGYVQVIVEGTGYEDLKRGPGHYAETAYPGQVGNFSVAGHRTTYGAPFNKIDTLRDGDAIVLETKTKWFTYTVQDMPAQGVYPAIDHQEIVDPTTVSVAYAVPDQPDPSLTPTEKLLTFTSCNPKYSAAQRIVVHAVLTSTMDKSPGKLPPALEGEG
jgi:sortase A